MAINKERDEPFSYLWQILLFLTDLPLQKRTSLAQRCRMTVMIDMGKDSKGQVVPMDLEELLATRLLVQGNSGSGKSHLLRRMLEKSARFVQQIVIDPEGDFVTLAERFPHVAVEAAAYNESEIRVLAQRIREHRVSVVLNLEGLDVDNQMKCAAWFLATLFDAPRDHWYPAIVVVDEAQIFAPAQAGEVSDEARRLSLAAMTNLMCRGRKRGLAGVIATQRLAKLAKNVAAEASNFLMGRTFLDIDMARAADLLGMDRRQAESIRDLERGHFLALGPALCRRPVAVKIGEVETKSRTGGFKLMPLPDSKNSNPEALLFSEPEEPALPLASPEPPPPPSSSQLMELLQKEKEEEAKIAEAEAAENPVDNSQKEALIDALLSSIVEEEENAYRQANLLYPEFTIGCRMHGLSTPPLDLTAFTKRLTIAKAGLSNDDLQDELWQPALKAASILEEDIQAVFLFLAKSAKENAPCPDDEMIARIYGTRSAGRARRLIGYMENQGIIAIRTDFGGRRSITLPALGWTTSTAA
ncbi:ATP-binding protein [Zymomonas sp.]|uniref:ATP-binding protein n=1 Tax=Zymomonas sp. TaxID=2068624 RepID=UPI0025FFCDD5|nr:ATP-binding protein [Zymomonas sp.]MCA1956378.1 ATP-binding protein [Zymomonas sp.]